MSKGMGQGGEDDDEEEVEEGANERSILRLFDSASGEGGEEEQDEQDENEALVNEEEGANERFFLGTNLLFKSEEDLYEHVTNASFSSCSSSSSSRPSPLSKTNSLRMGLVFPPSSTTSSLSSSPPCPILSLIARKSS